MSQFILQQSSNNINVYTQLLQKIGALSKLFSKNSCPYLEYRAMENIFCKAFEAENLSRGDSSIDAKKNKLGIGLKTFLHGGGDTYQKIAEFNKESDQFRDILAQKGNRKKIIFTVAGLRNLRLITTQQRYDIDQMIYHYITREKNKINLYEENMDLIDIDKIGNIKVKSNSILFTDNKNDYSFSLSKNTLFKKFYSTKVTPSSSITVEILKDPYDFLLGCKIVTMPDLFSSSTENDEDFIILPLYSVKTNSVEKKSGLNMWNAEGRPRDENEVYIPVPAWIHTVKPDFFTYKKGTTNTNSFNVKLPNGSSVPMKITQQGGKALQSAPNNLLGKWILRDILNIRPKELATKTMLIDRGIDSVRLTKVAPDEYLLDFQQTGSYITYYQKMTSIEN